MLGEWGASPRFEYGYADEEDDHKSLSYGHDNVHCFNIKRCIHDRCADGEDCAGCHDAAAPWNEHEKTENDVAAERHPFGDDPPLLHKTKWSEHSVESPGCECANGSHGYDVLVQKREKGIFGVQFGAVCSMEKEQHQHEAKRTADPHA